MDFPTQLSDFVPLINGFYSFHDWFYGSPPKTQRFSSTGISWLLDTRKDTINRKVSIYFLVCQGLSIDDVGVLRDTEIPEIRPGAGFETDDFVELKKSWGGYRKTTPAQTHQNHPGDPGTGYAVVPRGVADVYSWWGHTPSNTRDRNTTHGLQRWVSTNFPISELECIIIFILHK